MHWYVYLFYAFNLLSSSTLHLKVFLSEYAGPLVIYLIFYTRPAIIYGAGAASEPRAQVVK